VVAGGELTSEIVERAVAVLADRPSALVTDIDGTLSRIVPRPEDASVSTRARSALQTLVRQLDLVAVITGRPNEVARRMVGVEGIVYMGSYALDAASRVSLAESDLGLVRQLATGLLAEHPCVRLEEKEVSFALHYRNCDHPEHVGDALLEALAPLAESAAARLLEGKRVIEVAPAALPDKDVAFAKLAVTTAPTLRSSGRSPAGAIRDSAASRSPSATRRHPPPSSGQPTPFWKVSMRWRSSWRHWSRK
jgi:trehalose 6-phosphate phosphatase